MNMNQEQSLKSGISQISAGKRISKGRQAFYKSKKKNPSSKKIEECKFRVMTKEELQGKEDKIIESRSSIDVTI